MTAERGIGFVTSASGSLAEYNSPAHVPASGWVTGDWGRRTVTERSSSRPTGKSIGRHGAANPSRRFQPIQSGGPRVHETREPTSVRLRTPWHKAATGQTGIVRGVAVDPHPPPR